jgi:hypothetical protein
MKFKRCIFLCLSSSFLLATSALACDPPTYFVDRKDAILEHFCAAHTVAIVEVKDVFKTLNFNKTVPSYPTYGVHYKVHESFKGDPLTHGFMYSHRTDLGAGGCGIQLDVGDLFLIALTKDGGVHAGQMMMEASFIQGTKQQVTMPRIAYLRELHNQSKINRKLCAKVERTRSFRRTIDLYGLEMLP